MNTDIWELKEEYNKAEAVDNIDYKMVSFSLGGKDYGIDIMKVKEIQKVNKFTFVPNSEPYVRGVFNLRGDIISIIDLRIMFSVSYDENYNDLEDVIVLTVDDKKIGVIVDSINKVIGIQSSTIQTPHPIFSNINIKYINGIVEKDSKIYIILDIERIFGQENDIEQEPVSDEKIIDSGSIPEKTVYRTADVKTETDVNKDFIKETLKTFINFHVTDINEAWFFRRYDEWLKKRRESEENVQLSGVEDAEKFLQTFYSGNTGRFFDQASAQALMKIIPENIKGNYYIWNIGCGNGYETYSVAAVARKQNPDAAIKIWANDKDLLSISNAPNITVDRKSVPGYLNDFISEGTKGGVISQKLRDIIYFEYHDVKNHNPYPDVDMIICRDVLSFFDYNEQFRILSELFEKLKNNGILITGDNENIVLEGLDKYEEQGIVFYRKNAGI